MKLPTKKLPGGTIQVDPKATQSTLQEVAKAAAATACAEAEGQTSVHVQGLKNIEEAIKRSETADERREYVQATERITQESIYSSAKRSWLNFITLKNVSVASVLTGSIVGAAWLAKRLRG